MEKQNLCQFEVDDTLCIGCSRCIKVCPGGILTLNEEHHARMLENVNPSGTNRCWKCEHCLSVCPRGAIRIFGKTPDSCLPPPSTDEASRILDALVVNRHSHRRFLSGELNPALIRYLVDLLANAPNSGNKQLVEYTLVDDRIQMDRLRKYTYAKMDELADNGLYPPGYDEEAFLKWKHKEASDRPDILFCGAPYLLIPHAPLGVGKPEEDIMITAAYFELLCASRGLGAVMMSFPAEYISLVPELRSILQIPDDHAVPIVVGFGRPEIPYSRGSFRHVADDSLHHFHFPEDINK